MSGRKKERKNTPGTRGGPGGRDGTLAVKRRKNTKISFVLVNFLFMPKYWGSFPEVGQKQKTEREERRPKVGNNNGQLRIAKLPGPISIIQR